MSNSSLIDLSGKAALVTGGSGGIGRAIAQRLHAAGAAVVVVDVDLDSGGIELVDSFNAARPKSAVAVRAEVGVEDDTTTMIAAAVENFGSLDILVNNAGIFPFAPFFDISAELFERVLRVNLVGVLMAMQAGARQMISQGHGGKIINVTSINALQPAQAHGLASYGASKHGVWGLTKSAALELIEHGITVNAIAPGAIATPGTDGLRRDDRADALRSLEERIPMHRRGDPDEIGRVALFLASDLSSYLTGSQVVADGGLLLR